MREKLNELFKQEYERCQNIPCDECKYGNATDCGEDALVDHLIANGVTIQKWIPVSERLPEHGQIVLCYLRFGDMRILQWDKQFYWWLGYGKGDDWQKTDVTHWMPLPEMPKGE